MNQIQVGQTPAQSRTMAAIGWLTVLAIAILIPVFTLKYAGNTRK